MKNAIITFYNELNYGAILQAYALHKYMNTFSNTYVMNLNIELNKDNFVRKIFQIPKFLNFELFKKKYILSTKKVNNYNSFCGVLKKFDNAIVGSDQVWAYDLIKNYEKLFFLDVQDIKINKYSYAASFGKNDNLVQNKEKTLNYLKAFNKISLREKSSYELLKNELECVNSIDPTLLLNDEDYIKNFNLKKKNEKYILVYMLVIDQELIDFVTKLNEKLNYKIICFNNKNRFGKNGKTMPNVSPRKFVELFYNSSFVVTNSFHGTCFSLIFKKKFVSFIHQTKGIRQLDLLEKAGLLDRMYNEKNNIEDYIKNEIEIKAAFYEFVEESKQYLKSIGEKNE